MTPDGTSPDRVSDDLSLGEVMLGSLLIEAHEMHPDDLPAVVQRKAALVGLHEAVLLLADTEQVTLLPFPPGSSEPISIDASIAGRCYRRSEPEIVDAGSGHQVWFPLMDGHDRLGVLGAHADSVDAVLLNRGRQLAALVAGLIVSKSAYGDNLIVVRRRRPLSLAAEMRWALLPSLTFTSDIVSISGYLEPAYDIAGDAFDYAVDGDTVHTAIFDARGHGLTASRMANLALMSYRHSRRLGLSLVESYQAMDSVIGTEFGEEAFVTAQISTLELPSGQLQWVNAGHPAPLLLRGGRHLSELTGDIHLPVGLHGATGELNRARLEPGDRVAFYSDGVVEARSPAGEEFGLGRLGDFLVRAVSAQENPGETVRSLMHAILDHQSGDLADDATICILAWQPHAHA